MALRLSKIGERIAEAVPVIDRETNIQRTSRKGEKYLIGARRLGEQLFVEAVAEWWHTTHPTELPRFHSSHLESAFNICRSLGISESYARNLSAVVRRVDPNHYEYRLDPVVAIAHQALEINGLVSAQWESARFAGLTRHPCGTGGMVCGWEVQPALPS